jgi:starvation-inducible DNA-binding protein
MCWSFPGRLSSPRTGRVASPLPLGGATSLPNIIGEADEAEAERAMSKLHNTTPPTARPSGLTDLPGQASREITTALNVLLADVFALYLKTKNFHWHMSGPNFRDYHLLLDEQSSQIFAMTDPIAERVRKIGGTTIRSIGHIARLRRITENETDFIEPWDMLAELRDDNLHLTSSMRRVHDVCAQHSDVATTSQLEVWIDEAERRSWFLYEATRRSPGSNG